MILPTNAKPIENFQSETHLERERKERKKILSSNRRKEKKNTRQERKKNTRQLAFKTSQERKSKKIKKN